MGWLPPYQIGLETNAGPGSGAEAMVGIFRVVVPFPAPQPRVTDTICQVDFKVEEYGW